MKSSMNHDRKYLLISTLPKENPIYATVQNELHQKALQLQTILTPGMKINHCIGCNDCWIKTPGLCCIKDDYEQILIKILQADSVIFLTETKLGFVCSQMKNLIDRILPLDTMHLKFKNGQMRHYSRYKKQSADMALLYVGSADKDYMNQWLERVQINLHGRSLGAYEIDNREDLYHELTHN